MSRISRIAPIALWVMLLAACQAVPTDPNRGELVASEGVRKIFEEEDIDAEQAGERIRCERHRRVGTHLVTRVCMTIAEWEEKERRTSEIYRDAYEIAPCVSNGAGNATVNACGEGRGGL